MVAVRKAGAVVAAGVEVEGVGTVVEVGDAERPAAPPAGPSRQPPAAVAAAWGWGSLCLQELGRS